MTPVILPVIVLSGLGLVMAALLAVARKVFYVEVDERLEKLVDILPGANCGGCGFPGCSGYAAALVGGSAKPTICPPGGADLAEEIGSILGVEVEEVVPQVALVACAGNPQSAPERSTYIGISTCEAAHLTAGGFKSCTFGCLGLGSCAVACPFDAIVMTDNHLAVVIPELCNGCGNCVAACPRKIIKLVPAAEPVHVLCINPQKAKLVKAVCSVGCTGCKLCAKQSKRFAMTGALAQVDPTVPGEIPSHAPYACPQGTIFDSRRYKVLDWITMPACREEHEILTAEWKKAEKERKAAAKAKKAQKAKDVAREGVR